MMEFKSQICTTKEQSYRLLALGIKKKTADCMYVTDASVPEEYRHYDFVPEYYESCFEGIVNIPAWSLHRLLSMLPDDAPNLFWILNNANISIEQEDGSDFFPHRNSMYDSIIDCIGFLIKEEVFNKDYLEERK